MSTLSSRVPAAVKDLVRTVAVCLSLVPYALSGRRLGRIAVPLNGAADEALRTAVETDRLPGDWRIAQLLPGASDVSVARLRDGSGEVVGYLKLSYSERGNDVLRSERKAIAELSEDVGRRDWSRYLPRVLSGGMSGDREYTVESAVPGVRLLDLLTSSLGRQALDDAYAVQRAYHAGDSSLVTITEQHVDFWFGDALDRLRTMRAPLSAGVYRRGLDHLGVLVREHLVGSRLMCARPHGDFSSNNILVDPHTGRTTGVIDWDRAFGSEPVILDVVDLAVNAQIGLTGERLGALTRRMLRDPRCTLETFPGPELIHGSERSDPIPLGVLGLLSWLRHVGNNLRKSEQYSEHRMWIFHTIDPVLSALAASPHEVWR